VSTPKECLGVIDDTEIAKGLPGNMSIVLNDLSVYSKNYTVRPGLNADSLAILERAKPHDIFIQDVRTYTGAIFD
tara:strand:+ start:787 stop:1011 length:225 start_codon:yes stop_codon:yes gene_type:complete